MVWEVAFSPDGRYLATGSDDNTAKITEVESGQTLHTISHEDRVTGVAFSPNGRYLVTDSDDNTVKITEVESGQTLHTISHEAPIWGRVIFSPDERYLVTHSTGNTAKITAVETGQTTILQGHSDDVTDVVWHPDGDRMATSSRDGTVRVWTRMGQELAVFRGHQGRVRILWDEEGRTLTSVAIDDNTVTIRQLPVETLEELIARGCRWVRPYLTSNNKEMKECEEYWE